MMIRPGSEDGAVVQTLRSKQPPKGGKLTTLLDECICCKFSSAHVGVLLVGVLPVVMPLQRARYVAGVMAMGTAEWLWGQGVVK